MGNVAVVWQGAAGQLVFGFLSNLLFVLVLTAIGVLYVRAVLSRRSLPLRRMLGIGGHLPNKVWIMLSSIYVLQDGALGVTGRTGFYGPVMNQSEYVAAQLLRDAIRTRPAARPLRALLDQLGLLDTVHDPTECEIVFSSQYVDGVDGRPVGAHEYQPPKLSGDCKVVKRIQESMKEAGVYVLVGGPSHNAAVEYTLRNRSDKQARLTFDVGVNGALIIERGPGGKGVIPHDRVTGGFVDYFILQKISGFGRQNSTVFVCAGLSSLGTAAAVGLLASRWRDLARRFGEDDFALLYTFENRRDVAVPTAEDVDKALRTVAEIEPPSEQSGLVAPA
jgi:hypothetical protein